MPPAIVDSEDEDDEILAPDDRSGDVNGRGLSELIPTRSQGASDEHGRTSTAHLIRERPNFRQSPCDDNTTLKAASKMSATMLTSSSALAQLRAKRCHTTELASSQMTSPDRSMKRAKTAEEAMLSGEDDVDSAAALLNGREGRAHSSSAAFPRYSNGAASPANSPAGMRDTFLHHEPMIMFRDTGSTIPDNESTQQRWLKEAVSGGHSNNDPPVMISSDPNLRQSSSFPWSASVQQTQSASEHPGDVPTDQPQGIDTGLAQDMQDESPPDRSAPKSQCEIETPVSDEVDSIEVSLQQSTVLPPLPAASPEVQIPRGNVLKEGVVKFSDPVSPAPGPNRKCRKDDEVAEQASTELAVELPKDLYQPRPSRRRATFMAEESIDYSVVPEKAARKRRRTANDASVASVEDQEESELVPEKSPRKAEEGDKNHHRRERSRSEPKADEDETAHVESELNTSAPAKSEKNPQTSQQIKDGASPKNISPQDKPDVVVFKVPAKPPSSSAGRSSGRASRRHHTTIFEDHIDFVVSPRSPSLRQQQATREKAMKDTSSDSLQLSRRSRKSITIDDEDAEDELAGENTITAPAPKKRGRPRKSKEPKRSATESASAKANNNPVEAPEGGTEATLETSAAQNSDNRHLTPEGDDTIDTGVRSNAEQPEPEPEPEPNADMLPRVINHVPARENANGEAIDEVADESTTTPKAPRGSPTSHSSIKPSSKLPLRVGLSRHQRIPSLLRMVRPAKERVRR